MEQLENPPAGDEAVLMDLFENRVPPGVDEAAYVKASWLAAVVEARQTRRHVHTHTHHKDAETLPHNTTQ